MAKKKPSGKGDVPPPKCKAILLCARTIIEAGTGKIMTKPTLPRVENVKVLRREERAGTSSGVMTSNDAKRFELPDNCIVIPMRVLDRPEPIKRRRK